jgi:lipopolysaccharide transport system ATP-binding protein
VSASITRVKLAPPSDGLAYRHGIDSLKMQIDFRSDMTIPCPTLGVVIHGADGRAVTSAGNWVDHVPIVRDAEGHSSVSLEIPELPLLKGRYTVSVYVLCERSINLYSSAEHAANFEVVQDNVEQGVVSLPHRWAMETVNP